MRAMAGTFAVDAGYDAGAHTPDEVRQAWMEAGTTFLYLHTYYQLGVIIFMTVQPTIQQVEQRQGN